MEKDKLKLFWENFSLITVSDNKIPNFPWKSCQTEKQSFEKFIKNYDYKGGIIKKDGTEIPPTDNFGIVTGFEYLEVIDIDLKVLSTAKEQVAFWDEYLKYLKDNILDFDDKFVVYKTKNAGYHILYKSKRVQGNLKLSKLKGHSEAIIETRGVGGYVFTYPENKVSKKNYHQVDFISDDDREIIMSFSKMYNYIDEEPIQPIKDKKTYKEGDITPWDDYNSKTSIFDVIGTEFSIVANQNKRYVIKRQGGTSPHSGYIFKDTGCMYLFSTGTEYPHEKLITPFTAYAFKNHRGNLSEASKSLYELGFGTRFVKNELDSEKKTILEKEESLYINKDDLQFPLDIFPDSIQAYILECNKTLDSSVDYMGCAVLWLISLSIGNSMQIEVKRGWNEIATLWLSIVGKAGIGKTPSISNIIFPLEKINNREIANYIKEYEKFDFYDKLSKKEQEEYPEVTKPKKKQFIANDITLEALVDLHQESDNAVGVFKDELAGWFKDMNKYKQGSDLEFWLSCWSGKSVNLNRITRAGSFVSKPLISVLGGIQPTIFNTFYTDENKENGFMDRMLLSYPELTVESYNDREMDYNTIQWYSDTIISFFETVKNKIIKRDEEQNIQPILIKFGKEAKVEWIRIFNNITETQNSDLENEYMKSMLPKQKSYIPRFALLIHAFNAIGQTNYNFEEVSKESILKAEKLSKYFIAMAKKVKLDSVEVSDLKQSIKTQNGKTTFEKLKAINESNPEFNRLKTAELLGISRQQIYNLIKKL